MTRSEIERSLNELNSLVLQGRMMDAFEAFYHDGVVMQENNAAPTVSKDANRQRELRFLENGTAFRGTGVSGDLSFVIWQHDYTHRERGLRNYRQVSVQQWKDGKIIKELFVYDN